MNYRRLQYFLSVVDHGTVTSAAEELHIAQPALSRQLKTLEKEMKVRLFETRGNRLVLTPSGRAVVPLARKLLVQTRDLQDAVEVVRTGAVATLSCAATAASIRGFLAPFIATLPSSEPTIVAREVGHFDLEEALLHDLDFVVTPTLPTGNLASMELGGVPLKALVPAEHTWSEAARTSVNLADLCSEHLILPSHHSVSRRVFDEALSREGLRLGSHTECDDGLTIMALVASGRGIGICTELPAYGVRGIRIVECAGEAAENTPQFRLHVAWHQGHYAQEKIIDIATAMKPWVARQQN